jgi:hypothetical protein
LQQISPGLEINLRDDFIQIREKAVMVRRFVGKRGKQASLTFS